MEPFANVPHMGRGEPDLVHAAIVCGAGYGPEEVTMTDFAALQDFLRAAGFQGLGAASRATGRPQVVVGTADR